MCFNKVENTPKVHHGDTIECSTRWDFFLWLDHLSIKRAQYVRWCHLSVNSRVIRMFPNTFRWKTKKHQIHVLRPFVRGIHRWRVDFSCKGPVYVMLKGFLCHIQSCEARVKHWGVLQIKRYLWASVSHLVIPWWPGKIWGMIKNRL